MNTSDQTVSAVATTGRTRTLLVEYPDGTSTLFLVVDDQIIGAVESR